MKFLVTHTDNPGVNAKVDTFILHVDSAKQAYTWCGNRWGGFNSGNPTVGGTVCFPTRESHCNNVINLMGSE